MKAVLSLTLLAIFQLSSSAKPQSLSQALIGALSQRGLSQAQAEYKPDCRTYHRFCQECDTDDPRQCKLCEFGWLLTRMNKCVRKTCKESYCITCDDKERCQECEYPFVILDGVCELQCPVGTREDSQQMRCLGEADYEEIDLLYEVFGGNWGHFFFICVLCGCFSGGYWYHRRKQKRDNYYNTVEGKQIEGVKSFEEHEVRYNTAEQYIPPQ